MATVIIVSILTILSFALGYGFAAASYQKALQSYERFLEYIFRLALRSEDLETGGEIDFNFLRDKNKNLES